jgi:hypothetical protein
MEETSGKIVKYANKLWAGFAFISMESVDMAICIDD